MTTFAPPAKGQWISLRDHFPHALTPEYERLLCAAMPEGERGPFAEYGMPVATLVARTVHGHVYVAPEPLLGGFRDGLPPRPLLPRPSSRGWMWRPPPTSPPTAS